MTQLSYDADELVSFLKQSKTKQKLIFQGRWWGCGTAIQDYERNQAKSGEREQRKRVNYLHGWTAGHIYSYEESYPEGDLAFPKPPCVQRMIVGVGRYVEEGAMRL